MNNCFNTNIISGLNLVLLILYATVWLQTLFCWKTEQETLYADENFFKSTQKTSKVID